MKLTTSEAVRENFTKIDEMLMKFSRTDSQALKRAELKGYLQKWKDAPNPISLVIYLDVLSPLKKCFPWRKSNKVIKLKFLIISY